MIRFTVIWDPEVEVHFLDHWLHADSQTRAVLTAIANWIDTTLSVDPDKRGRPLKNSPARALAVSAAPPPARVFVVYSVSIADRQARVLRIVFTKG